MPRQHIKELILSIISLRGLHLPGKNVYYHAFDLYVTHNISFADAYNAVYMFSEEISNIYTWDTDFDRIDGIVGWNQNKNNHPLRKEGLSHLKEEKSK